MRKKRKGKQQRRDAELSRYDHHHLLPQSRGGGDEGSNKLLLKRSRHIALHDFLKQRSLEEIIELLIRVHRAKKRCLSNCKYCRR